jgi:hypothetical protein
MFLVLERSVERFLSLGISIVHANLFREKFATISWPRV